MDKFEFTHWNEVQLRFGSEDIGIFRQRMMIMAPILEVIWLNMTYMWNKTRCVSFVLLNNLLLLTKREKEAVFSQS